MTLENIWQWRERWGGWALVVLLVAIPLIRWAMLAPLGSRFLSGYMAFTSVGRLLGLIGFVLFAINFVLSLRHRWLENWFGGLNRVYVAHHIIGGLALIFLLFHPLLLALREIDLQALKSVRVAAQFLLPKGLSGPPTMLQQSLAIDSGMIAFTGLVTLMIITFFVKLPYQLWLFIHKFLGVAFLFAGLHMLLINADVSSDGFLRIYLILWLVIGLAAYAYRTLTGSVFTRLAPYLVGQVQNLPGNIVELRLKPLAKPIDFKPGQFVFVRFLGARQQGIGEEWHPFSIASPQGQKTMRLCIRALGNFTASLKRLPKGTKVEVHGAFGRFTPGRYPDRPQVWIASGIGVTPFLSIAGDHKSNQPVDFFYRVHNRSEIIDRSVWQQGLPAQTKFNYHPLVKDRLTIGDITKQIKDLPAREIFICGPPAMMRTLRQQLRKKGVHSSHIHTEEFTLL
jgi:predicted ferric reductase